MSSISTLKKRMIVLESVNFASLFFYLFLVHRLSSPHIFSLTYHNKLLVHVANSSSTAIMSACPIPVEGVDVCPPSWADSPEFQGQDSYFGGAPPLPTSVGYIIVIGFGVFFSLFTTAIVYLDKYYSKNKGDGALMTSEHFK
jgi:hypothetical protein